ncbi:hypothetical protein [Bacillus xiapuensis]|uniref:Uncharacterized protein n=1 Tax=Bacillus xiapuensis TaxID=2014075 RepID=A0ABU6N7U1_9BACI|nr:hypothetical protein [Bacillus xiapuensis]
MQLINEHLPAIKELTKNRELKLIGYTESSLVLYITQIGYIGAYYHSKPRSGRGLGVGHTMELLILRDYIKFARSGADIMSSEAQKHIIKRYSFNEYNKDSFDLNKAVEKAVMKELNKRDITK